MLSFRMNVLMVYFYLFWFLFRRDFLLLSMINCVKLDTVSTEYFMIILVVSGIFHDELYQEYFMWELIFVLIQRFLSLNSTFLPISITPRIFFIHNFPLINANMFCSLQHYGWTQLEVNWIQTLCSCFML